MRVLKFVSSHVVTFDGESYTFDAKTTVTFVNGGQTVNVIHTWNATSEVITETFHITEWGYAADRFTLDNVVELLSDLFLLGQRVA